MGIKQYVDKIEFDAMKAERDALAAQAVAKDKEIEKVKAVTMRLAEQSGVLASVSEQLKVFCKNLAAGNIPEFHKAEALRQALSYEDALIKQHLAEIRAQAGRDGFIAGANSMKLAFQYGGTYNTEDKAGQYADKIRQDVK